MVCWVLLALWNDYTEHMPIFVQLLCIYIQQYISNVGIYFIYSTYTASFSVIELQIIYIPTEWWNQFYGFSSTGMGSPHLPILSLPQGDVMAPKFSLCVCWDVSFLVAALGLKTVFRNAWVLRLLFNKHCFY